MPDIVPGKAVGQLVTQNGRRLTESEFLAWLQVCIPITAYVDAGMLQVMVSSEARMHDHAFLMMHCIVLCLDSYIRLAG